MSQPMVILKEWEPFFVALTTVVVLLLFFKVSVSLKADGMFDRLMPTGSNNLAYAGLRDDTGSTNGVAKMLGVEGMVSVDQGPSFWGPTAYQQVANDQASGIASDSGAGGGMAWTGSHGTDPSNLEGMSSRLSKIQVAEGMRGQTSVVLNPY